jgi:hypothetical protein
MLRKYADSMAILVIASILTVLAFIWKGYAFSNLSTVLIGDQLDTLSNAANLYQAFDNLRHRPGNLTYGLFFYNDPTPMVYTIAPYSLAVVLLPLYLLLGQNLELTLNLYLLATYPLTAWAVFLLVRYLFNAPQRIAIVAGLVAGFAQWRFLHVVHFESLSTQFYLFSIYFLHRLIDEPRLKWGIGFAVLFWLTFFTSGYLGMMVVITVGIIGLFTLITRRRDITRRLLLQSALAAIVLVSLSLPLIAFRLSGGRILHYELKHIRFFAAQPQHWFAGTSMLYFPLMKFRDERNVAIGIIPLVLSVLAWRYRHLDIAQEHRFTSGQIVALYTLIIVTGYVLTLGPMLSRSKDVTLPMPYMLLLKVLPGFSSMRVPPRFIVLAILGTAVLLAYTLTAFSLGFKRFNLIFALIIVGLIIELFPLNRGLSLQADLSGPSPMNAAPPTIPTSAYEWLAKQPFPTAVYHYPAPIHLNHQHIYTLTRYRQPMINGFGSFYPSWYSRHFWHYRSSPHQIALLRDHHVQYMFVHNRMMSDKQQTGYKKVITPYIQQGLFTFVQRLDDVDIYKLAPVGTPVIQSPIDPSQESLKSQVSQ